MKHYELLVPNQEQTQQTCFEEQIVDALLLTLLQHQKINGYEYEQCVSALNKRMKNQIKCEYDTN